MKKKILLITVIIAVLACLFAISVGAKTITYEGEEIELVDNLGDPSWYTGTTASKIQDKESIVILKDENGNMTAYPSYYIFRYLIEGSSVKINWADQNGVDYSFVNGNTTKYTAGSIYYAEIPYGITTFTPVNIWNKTETNVVELVFPDSMTSLENNTFENVKKLKKVTMSKNLTSVQMWTFNGATGLETVIFPEGSVLTTIGKGCFNGCTSLSSINLENCKNLKTLSDAAFSGCKAIDKLSLPDSIETIGFQALYNLGDFELASNYLPKNLKSIDQYFMSDCKLKNEVLYFPAGFTSFSARYCFIGTFAPKTSLTLVFLGEMTNVNLADTPLTSFTNNGDKQPIKLVFAQNQHSNLGGSFFTLVDFNGQNGVIIDYADGTKPSTSKEGTLTVTFSDTKYSGTQLGKDANNNTVLLADSGVEMIFCGGNTVDVSCYIYTRLLDGTLVSCHTTSKAYDVEGHKTAGIHYDNIVVESLVNCGYDGVTTNTCVLCDRVTSVVVPATNDHKYTVDDDCTTSHACLVCEKIVVEAALEHNEQTTITYVSFDTIGTKTTCCTNEGCTRNITVEAPAFFTCLGYSAFENGKGEFSLNFRVNNEAIKDYMDITGEVVTYGLFATTKDAIGDKDIVSSNGTLADGAVMAEIPFDSFVALTIKMGGFKDDNQKASEFAIGAYVAVDDPEGKKYSYLQNEKPQDGAKYSFTTYNQITKPQN